MQKKKTIVGLTEKINIIGKYKTKVVVARIDTGATVSSIDAALAKEMKLGKTIKTKLVRSSHGTTLRPIKKMKFTLGRRRFNMNFTISDRKGLKYKVLIGQNILKKDFLIDPNKK